MSGRPDLVWVQRTVVRLLYVHAENLEQSSTVLQLTTYLQFWNLVV